MQLNKPMGDEGQSGRDHRVRSSTHQDQVTPPSPGSPTERTKAGGPVPVSKSDGQPLREGTKTRESNAKDERHRDAEREIARLLRLPGDTRLDIRVDVDSDEVRFLIRDRESGELLREVPPDDHKPLLEKLREYSGLLVDRSF